MGGRARAGGLCRRHIRRVAGRDLRARGRPERSNAYRARETKQHIQKHEHTTATTTATTTTINDNDHENNDPTSNNDHTTSNNKTHNHDHRCTINKQERHPERRRGAQPEQPAVHARLREAGLPGVCVCVYIYIYMYM